MEQHWTTVAANDAVKSIPPAWGLEATVAVNPFLGQTDKSLAETAALLERVAGERIFPDRDRFRAKYETGEITDDDLRFGSRERGAASNQAFASPHDDSFTHCSFRDNGMKKQGSVT